MKKLQNNFTTPEQSKRLLELGVPADSADCYLLRTHTKGDTFIVEVLHDELYSKKDKFTNMLEYLPCWSVCRLMEIDLICRNRDYYLGRCLAVKNYDIPLWENGNYSICDYCVDEFIARIKLGDYDFSKLEG